MTQQGFLEAVRESPDDDLHRLAWADWLDDENQPERAAFIRASVRQAGLPDSPARDDLEDEADDLLALHESSWLESLSQVALDWQWQRGFIESATVPAGRVKEFQPILERFPLRELRLIGNESTYSGLASWEYLHRLESLDLGRHSYERPGPSIPSYRDSAFRDLLASPHLGTLQGLRLNGHELTGATAQLLIDYGFLTRLQRLSLHGCGSIGDRVSRQLAETNAPHLMELNLANTNISEYGMRNVLAAGRWPSIRRLHLSIQALFRRGLTEDSLRAELFHAPLLPRLGVLDFSHRMLDRWSLASLLRCPRLGPIEDLRLHDCRLDADAIAVLADWAGLAEVRSLSMGNNRLGDQGLTTLAHSPYLSGLRHLDLYANQIGGAGLSALANAPALGRLRTLNLSSNYVGLSGVKILAEGSLRLVGLWLNGDNLGPPAGQILSESPAFARLRSLYLAVNRLNDQGVRELCQSPILRRLRVLALDRNGLDTPCLDALLCPGSLPAIKVLTLNDNGFSDSEKVLLRRRFGGGLSV